MKDFEFDTLDEICQDVSCIRTDLNNLYAIAIDLRDILSEIREIAKGIKSDMP